MAQRILGLDIGQSAVKGVVIETTLRTAQVVGFHSEPVTIAPESGEEMAHAAQHNAVRNLMEMLGPVEQVVTALPSDRQACSALDMPFSDTTKIDQTLPFQLDDLTPFDVDDLIYDYQFISKDRKGPSRILVGTAPRQEVGDFLEEIQGLDIDPRIVMMEGLPYIHLYDQMIDPPDVPVWAVLDLGDHHATLVVFQKNEEDGQNPVRVELVRTIKRGTHHLKQALHKAFQFDQKECHEWLFNYIDLKPQGSQTDERVLEATTRSLSPFLAEWRRTLGSVERRISQAPQHLYITGGGAYIHGLSEFLSQRLRIEVSRLELTRISTGDELEWTDQPYTYFKALGLAMRYTKKSIYSNINLRQREFSFKGDLQFLKERIRPILFGLAVLFVLFWVSVITQIYARSATGHELRKEVKSRCQEILNRDVGPGRCLRLMRGKIQQVRGGSSTALIPRVSARDVFFEVYDRVAKLAKRRKYKIVITTWRITEDRFNIEGETTSFAAVGQIEQELKTFQCFQNLTKGKLQKQGAKVVFRIRARISC